jgi:hypothetical protein
MYTGPFVRTYYSMGAYRNDAARMQSQGYQAINVEQTNMTYGGRLTLILLFGLLLTPICIGVVILCFLPTAFAKKYNVTYLFQPSVAPSPSQPLTPSMPMPSMPSTPPSTFALTMPPTIPPTGAPMKPPQSFQPPQQPQQSPRQMSRALQYLIVAGAVLLTVGSCGGVVALAVNASNSSTSQANNAFPTDTPYLAPTYPPSTPAPTTPAPTVAPSLVIFAPTLGGTINDFDQRYGPYTDGIAKAYEWTIAGQKVEITLSLDDTTQSLDGQMHVVDVQVRAAAGEQWSSTVASTIAKTFLPADAKYQKTTTTSGVRDYVYLSKGMKATFTADQFTNGFGNVTVAAGTANYSCQRVAPATSGYELCDISIGVY